MALMRIEIEDTDLALALAQVAKCKVAAELAGDESWREVLGGLSLRLIQQLAKAIVREVLLSNEDGSLDAAVQERVKLLEGFAAL